MSSNPCNMAIFQFFSMAAAAIVDFIIFKFLTVGMFNRVKLHHCAKFHWNHSHRNGDIVIFRFFKMAAAAILDFWNFKFLTVAMVKRVELRHHAKFVEIAQTAAEIWPFYDFQDGGRRHLGFSKFQIFNGGDGQEGRTTSPCQISLKSAQTRPKYSIYRFFKMAAAIILDFKNFKFLTVGPV